MARDINAKQFLTEENLTEIEADHNKRVLIRAICIIFACIVVAELLFVLVLHFYLHRIERTTLNYLIVFVVLQAVAPVVIYYLSCFDQDFWEVKRITRRTAKSLVTLNGSDFYKAKKFVTSLYNSGDYHKYICFVLEVEDSIETWKEERREQADLHLDRDKSEFTGNFFMYILYVWLSKVLNTITLGFIYPYIVVKRETYFCKHTKLDGKQLYFTGTVKEIYSKWIKWLLLSFVTVGIYYILVNLKIKKWVADHTHVEGGLEELEGDYDTELVQRVIFTLVNAIAKAATGFTMFTFLDIIRERFDVTHTTYEGMDMYFDGKGKDFFLQSLKWAVLGICTLGVYFLFIPVNMEKYRTKHTHLIPLFGDQRNDYYVEILTDGLLPEPEIKSRTSW